MKRFQGIVSAILLTIVCCAVGQFPLPLAQAQTFSDPGFTSEVVTTLPQFLPVGVTWATDGRMFIWQRNGVIRIYKNGQLLPTPFLDISANVNTFDDRGMLGLALHPNFIVNGYVYVIYVREDGGNPNDSNPKIERLSRFVANAQSPDVALPNSETILMTIPNDFHHHEHGTLKFGPDGKLFVGHGDDTTAGGVDGHAFVAQDLNDPRGKILRVTEDGNAPGDNPFDDGTNSIRSKVYSYGLRNPFRFTLHPVSGEPYLGDVGWNVWEEFSRGRGKNFGWPCYEGVNPQPEYQNSFPSQCAPLTSSVVTAPLLSYPHTGTGAPFIGSTAVGGPFYTATLYPEVYRGAWFITDYVEGWIRRMVFDGAGNMTSTVPFATGLSGPVDLELGPDGMLYYVSIITGQVVRIRYNGPSAVASATPSSGLSPLTVNFSSAGSSSPNGTPLTYLWEFGDSQTSNAANPSHTYVSATVQTYTVKLTVITNTNQSSSATVKVTIGSLPPTATIQSPTNGTGVLPGQSIVYQGSATDPENGTIPSAGLSWTIILHHNDHVHTQLFTTGPTGSATIQYHGIGTYSYEFRLTATDSSGLTHTTSVTLPVLGDTTPPSNPSGLVATVAGPSQINLTWTASTDNSGVTSYLVERCQGVGCTNFVQIATSNANSYSDTSVAGGTSYSYRIRAVDASGNLSLTYTNISSVTVGGVSSLVTAYGMNEGSGTTLADASGAGHTGTLVNGPTWVASQATYGQALSFDGVNDAVSVANPATYNFGTADFTIALWAKRNVLGGAQRHLVSKCAATAWAAGCKELYFDPGNRLTFGSYSTGDTFSSTIADTNWHHIAVTFTDSTNTLRIYVDGALITTATQALEADNATHVVTLGNQQGSNPFSGLLDELRIYSRVLSLAEIQADRTTPIAPPGPADGTPPSNVTNLTSTAGSATQINLSWTAATDNVGVTGYRVERCQGASCTNFAQIATPAATTFGDTSLAASTSYSYRVKAVDAAGNVSVNYSNVATATTAAAPLDTVSPTNPTGLTATAASSSQINLVWTASTDSGGSGLAGYGVERCQGVGCTNFVQIATTSTNSYSDTGLTAGTSYSYRIRAVDGAGNASNYTSISATTSGGGGLSSLVTAYGMNEGSGTTLADASGAGHTGTLVNGPTWVASQATYGQALSFDGVNDAVSVANPATYNFGTADFTIALWAKRNVLGGAQRHLVSKCAATAWTAGCKELYFDPGNRLTFGSYSTGDTFSSTIADTNWHHIAVTFTDSTNTLRVYVDGALITTATQALEADTATHVVTLGNQQGSNPFSGLLDELRIYSRVLTLAEIQADRTTPITPPGPADSTPPSNVTNLTSTAGSATQINLSWTAATDSVGVTGYRVERCQGASCTNFVQIATPAGTTFGDTSLAASTNYSYRVKAVDAAGNVSVNYSNVANATTFSDTIPPTDPSGLAATAVSSSQINLTWTASTDSGGSGLAGYGVERCQGVGCTSFVQIATTSTNSYSNLGLTTGTSYSYRIRAVDGAGNSSNYTNTASATPQTVTTTLITAYGINEGSGTTLADASGVGHTGTLVNGPTWVASQATYGQALSFDGVNDAVSVANPAIYNFGTADFTIALWAKRNVLGGAQRHLVSKCAATAWAVGCKELYFDPSNRLAFGSYSTGDTFSSTIADTNWHHIAVTFTDSTNTLRVYVDGALITTATKALEADTATHVVTLGNQQGSNPFSGLLDELRIYSRVLSLAEIQTDRTTPITP